MDKKMEKYFTLAADETLRSMERGDGGPFGATVVKDGEVIVAVGNTQMRDTDPTAHAEIVAIREACKKLGTRDLSGCEIYATCEPCPMCVGAIIWSGIKDVYYSNDSQDADKYGFGDMHLRHYLDHTDKSVLNMVNVEKRDEWTHLFEKFHELNPAE
ncbi:nucleoside deaminase [Jeotgalibaca sp. A127]|uniref:nucleoside deaminase n=1 Tax=Jeotgalibaca sp. A127 TaxID=3457324 RepID=UPI003FD51F7F